MFAENPGVWMFHCHNLPHAAHGLVTHVAYAGVTTPFLMGVGERQRAGMKLEVVDGDIAALEVDAVANAANNHLWMGAGVAGALKRAGGEEIEREAVAKGPIPVGDAVATGAGRLPARWVIHGAVMAQDLRTNAELVERTTRSVLRVADELGAESLALPAFGTGVGGFPLDECARLMVARCARTSRARSNGSSSPSTGTMRAAPSKGRWRRRRIQNSCSARSSRRSSRRSTEDGRVDLDRFRELAEFLVDNGSDGLVVCGTTGEAPTLTDDEKFALWETAVDLLGGRATVVAGTGTYDTAHSIHLSQKAPRSASTACSSSRRTTTSRRSAAIVEHFKAIAAATDRPIVVYNIPSRVVINIEPETIEQLADIPTVRAVKQAYDDLDEAAQIPGFGLDLYAGDDNLIYPFLELGGVGGICVHTHVVGPQVKEMVRAFRERRPARAKEIDEQLAPAYELLKVVGEPDRDQGGAEAVRPRRRRPAPAARGGDRGRDGARPLLPRASRRPRRRLSYSFRDRRRRRVTPPEPSAGPRHRA